jgi:hypothetical protein
VSDDGLTSTGNEGNLHTYPHEEIARSIIPKSYNINKIYLAAYPSVLTSAGRRKPAVNEDIINTMNNGSILVSFMGHGNPDLWTHEVVFDKNSSIPRLTNNNRLFFLVAATCNYADFDKVGIQSGTEELLTKGNGGGIAGFAAARLVYAQLNTVFQRAFFNNLLNSASGAGNAPITIGEASFRTKRSYFDKNDQKYHLIGDPLIRLRTPQHTANIDSINNIGAGTPVQIRALSNTEVTGRVLRNDGSSWDSFNGEGIMTMYDSERRVYLEQISDSATYQGGVIFRGRVSITGGRFKANFVVPKDISYENNRGKIVFYFIGNEGDGVAASNNIIVGGTDTITVNDGKGPEIEIYFDNISNKNASIANPGSTLIVELSDETGINTTGTGIGHKLEGIFNDNSANPVDFSNYFTGDIDSGGKTGKINYKMNNFDRGEYKLEMKAWDVFNNFSKEVTYFTVVTGDEISIRDVFNYPNPFSGSTTFTFQNNLEGYFDVTIKIYTVAGRLIKEIEKMSENRRYVTIDWDGRDADGGLLANGAYFYKVIVKSLGNGESRSILGKLAVVR